MYHFIRFFMFCFFFFFCWLFVCVMCMRVCVRVWVCVCLCEHLNYENENNSEQISFFFWTISTVHSKFISFDRNSPFAHFYLNKKYINHTHIRLLNLWASMCYYFFCPLEQPHNVFFIICFFSVNAVCRSSSAILRLSFGR